MENQSMAEQNTALTVDDILSRHNIKAEEKPQEPETRTEPEQEQASLDESEITTKIGRYVHRCWQEGRQAKSHVEQTLLRCLRQREGVYDPDKMQAIKEQGGSQIYMLLTQLKIRSAKAWIKELMTSGSKIPMGAQATPVSEIPQPVKQRIRSGIRQELNEAVQMGLYPKPEDIRKRVESVAADVLKAVQAFAETRAELMETYMHDQMQEGGYMEALDELIDDFLTYPVAIMKGPYNIMGLHKKYQFGYNEKVQVQVEKGAMRKWKCVSPFDIYTSADSRSLHDGWMIERMKLRRKTLYDLIGLPGYDESVIRAIIDEYGDSGYRLPISNEAERNRLEGRHHDHFSNDATMDTINFWGSVRGEWLLEWGVPERMIPDKHDDYEANVIMVGRHVIRAAINPDPMRRRPYKDVSFERANNSIWAGKGLAQVIKDLQDMCNATARALSNNMALASGPMVEISVDRLASGQGVQALMPWMQVQTRESKVGSGSGGRAINFFQPNSNANELIGVFKFYSGLADEYSGIPPYTMGSNVSGGAASTASGLGMLVEGAARGVKLAVASLDKVTEYTGQCLFDQIMLNDNVPHLKGDVKIIATGTKGVLNREQANMRRMDLLQILMQPGVIQFIGPKSVVMTLREIFEGFDLDPKNLPSEDELRKQIMQVAQQQQQQTPQPGVGREMTPSGAVAGGADVRAA